MHRPAPTRDTGATPGYTAHNRGAVLRLFAVVLAAGLAIPAHAQDIQPPQGQQQFQHQHQDRHMHGRGHLGEWMADHQNLSPEEQQKALAEEPGFKSLPPEQQQRALNRLAQLNSMPPEQRQRFIDRNEDMERLTPDQRQQVRSAMAQLGSLPPDRRRAVARTFHEFRTMPPDQRQQIMSSPEYQQQFSGQERDMLNNLMAVDPYLPSPTPWR